MRTTTTSGVSGRPAIAAAALGTGAALPDQRRLNGVPHRVPVQRDRAQTAPERRRLRVAHPGHLLYSGDLGLYQITRALGAEMPTERELRPLVRELQEAFLR
jgi:hypothetical protein